MRNCLLLAKILIKNGTGMTAANTKKRQSAGQIFLYFFVCICMLPLLYLLYELSGTVYQALAPLNLQGLVYELLCVILSLTLLVLSLPYVLSVMFFSKDLEHFLPMPLCSWQIVGAKFITVMVFEYLTALIAGIPLMAGIAAEAQAEFTFWLIAIPVLLAIPVLPVIYASFLGTLALYLTRSWKHKEAFMTFFSLILILLSSGIGILVSRLGETPDPAAILEIMTGSRPIVTGLSWVFPNLFLAKNALMNQDFITLILYLLSTVFLVGVFLLFGNRVYLKAVSGMTESSAKKERLSEEATGKALRTSSAARAFASREWKLLVRTPVYFLNCVVTAFILPLILLMMVFFSASQMGDLLLAFEQFLPLIQKTDASFLNGLLLLIVFAVSGMMASMNLTPATCISREGQNFGDLKCLPVSARDILKGKMICALSISAAAVYPYAIALPLLGIWLFQAPLWLLAASLLIATFTIIMLGYLMLLGDLLKPKLNWTSEQAAVKQNLTAMLADLLCMVLCLVLGFGAVMLYQMSIPMPAVIIISLLVIAFLAFSLQYVSCRYAEKAFARLEM